MRNRSAGVGQLARQNASQQRFARAGGAGEHGAAARVLDDVPHFQQRSLMALAGIVEPRIVAVLKRSAIELPVGFVHGDDAILV